MVSSLWVTPVGAASAMLLAFSIQGSPATDDSMVCANATRDWNEIADRASPEAIRAFQRNRVRPECPRLAARIRDRLATLQQVRTPAPRVKTPPPTRPAARAAEPTRRTEPVTRVPTRHAPAAAPRRAPQTPARTRPFFRRDSMLSDQLASIEPNWHQVLARYPHLERLYDQGGRDLCAACIVGAAGYLDDCWIAGARAHIREIREGAKLMISMIRVTRHDGNSATGLPVGVPVHFGRLLPPPEGGYCSNPEVDFRP